MQDRPANPSDVLQLDGGHDLLLRLDPAGIQVYSLTHLSNGTSGLK